MAATNTPGTVADLVLPSDLVTDIASGDGMFSGNATHYFKVGRSAITCLELALKCASKKKADITSVLDFGCGFGRVTRWLVSAFPHAEIVAMDVDRRAVDAVSKLLRISAYAIDRQWETVPRVRFDLIWCGSLFTHLDRQTSEQLFSLLCDRLHRGGVLATTTHGTYVAERLRQGKATYTLSADAIDGLLGDYDRSGYGYRPYTSTVENGISVCKPYTILEMGSAERLTPLLFAERGWMRHQDLVAFHDASARKLVTGTTLDGSDEG